ncbi:unnamed protein product [Polarella glacialis]|uniref:Uncharacterized protein n=1 Tax=Polarella glacialis TaxID=89957 RepID=A0A813F622_POLGL|nr:unnamed protein product [Polarella glacialis]
MLALPTAIPRAAPLVAWPGCSVGPIEARSTARTSRAGPPGNVWSWKRAAPPGTLASQVAAASLAPLLAAAVRRRCGRSQLQKTLERRAAWGQPQSSDALEELRQSLSDARANAQRNSERALASERKVQDLVQQVVAERARAIRAAESLAAAARDKQSTKVTKGSGKGNKVPEDQSEAYILMTASRAKVQAEVEEGRAQIAQAKRQAAAFAEEAKRLRAFLDQAGWTAKEVAFEHEEQTRLMGASADAALAQAKEAREAVKLSETVRATQVEKIVTLRSQLEKTQQVAGGMSEVLAQAEADQMKAKKAVARVAGLEADLKSLKVALDHAKQESAERLFEVKRKHRLETALLEDKFWKQERQLRELRAAQVVEKQQYSKEIEVSHATGKVDLPESLQDSEGGTTPFEADETEDAAADEAGDGEADEAGDEEADETEDEFMESAETTLNSFPEAEAQAALLREQMELIATSLREDAGFTEDEINEDPEVAERLEVLKLIEADPHGNSWKVLAADRGYHAARTKKESRTFRMRKKTMRREGRLGPSWDNRLTGKDRQSEKEEQKTWIKQRRKAKLARRKKLLAAAGAEDGSTKLEEADAAAEIASRLDQISRSESAT